MIIDMSLIFHLAFFFCMQSKVHQATVDPFTSQYVINNQKLDSGKCLPHAREYGLPSQVTKALKADLGVVVELFALLPGFLPSSKDQTLYGGRASGCSTT